MGMANSPMCVDAQEGYVDLDISYRYKIDTPYNQNDLWKEGRILNFSPNKSRVAYGYYTCIEDNKKARKILTLELSTSKLFDLYDAFYNDIDKKIEITQKKMNEWKVELKKKHRKTTKKKILLKISRLNRDIRMLNNTTGERWDFNVIKGILAICPTRYYSYEYITDDVVGDSEGRLTLEYFKVNTKIIPYLLNKKELMQLQLDKKEISMLKAMEELTRLKIENYTFDDHINGWIKELLGSASENPGGNANRERKPEV